MQVVTREITPEFARKLLENNRANRPVDRATVSRYAVDMRAGRWRHTHQGFCVGKDDTLVDGQHRCLAIIEAGVPITAQITYDDAVTSAMDVPLDEGRRRSVQDSYNLPSPLVYVARAFGRVCESSNTLTNQRVVDYAGVLEGVLDVLLIEGTSSVRKTLSAAAVRVGAMLHMVSKPLDVQVQVAKQYRALVLQDFANMTPSVCSLYRVLVGTGARGDSTALHRAYIAFDPARPGRERITLRDPAKVASEIRAKARELLSPLFAARGLPPIPGAEGF